MSAAEAARATSATAPEEPARPPSLPAALLDVWQELRAAVGGRALLLSLEARRAGVALSEMVMLAVLAALLLCAAWIALMAGVFMTGLAFGLRWPGALALVIVLDLGAAAFAWGHVRRLSEHLSFPATREAMHREAHADR
jgi:hypothetical protein